MSRVIVLAVLSLVAIGEAGAASEQGMASRSGRHLIEIHAFSFMPQQAVVAPGDTIRWVNRDIVPHTVTAEQGLWAPKTLAEGESWELIIEEGGTYPYFCEFHPHMKGLVAASANSTSSQ
ncbi:MAG: cupredoxin family copper-binding protein [Nitrospiraceae bacterium]